MLQPPAPPPPGRAQAHLPQDPVPGLRPRPRPHPCAPHHPALHSGTAHICRAPSTSGRWCNKEQIFGLCPWFLAHSAKMPWNVGGDESSLSVPRTWQVAGALGFRMGPVARKTERVGRGVELQAPLPHLRRGRGCRSSSSPWPTSPSPHHGACVVTAPSNPT